MQGAVEGTVNSHLTRSGIVAWSASPTSTMHSLRCSAVTQCNAFQTVAHLARNPTDGQRQWLSHIDLVHRLQQPWGSAPKHLQHGSGMDNLRHDLLCRLNQGSRTWQKDSNAAPCDVLPFAGLLDKGNAEPRLLLSRCS